MLKNILWAAAGGVVGVYIANYRLRSYYEERLLKESEEARDHFKRFYEKKTSLDVERLEKKLADREQAEVDLREAAMEAAGALENYQGISVHKSVIQQEEAREVQENSLDPDSSTDPTNLADFSHIITKEEWNNTPEGYESFTFSYFASDDILSNFNDKVIGTEAREEIINDVILAAMKSAIEDEETDVIYVRNDKAKWDFDIAISPGLYSEEVGADEDGAG